MTLLGVSRRRHPGRMALPIPGMHGAHLRRDLVELLGRRRLAAAIRNHEVEPLWTGVVVESALLLAPMTRAAAALLTSGPDAVLARETAAFVHGCRSVDTVSTHIQVPYGCAIRGRNGLVVHHGGFFADDVEVVDGLRVLPLDRVVADLLCLSRPPDALAVVDEALMLAGEGHGEFRRAVAARLGRRQDPRGTIRGGGLLDLASERVASPAESWMRWLLIDGGLPVPEVNWPLCGPDGREHFRLDLAWPELRVCLEFDGRAAHAGRETQDEARAAELRRRGWIVIRADSADLSSPTRLFEKLRAAFAERGYSW